MQKLWDKGYEPTAEIERFTVGRDREMDMYLAEADVLGSMAHITMLESIGLLEKDELRHRGRHRGRTLASRVDAYSTIG